MNKLISLIYNGFPIPTVLDTKDGKPSTTLTMTVVAHIVAVLATINLRHHDALQGAIQAGVLWLLSMVFYRLKKLDSVKFDLDDKSFELKGGEDESNSNSK